MNNFDPNLRARLVRAMIAVLAIIVLVIVMIGFTIGAPSGPASSLAQITVLPPTDEPPTPTAAPLLEPTLAPTADPAAVSTPTDGWLVRSQETFDQVSTWPANQQTGWASGYEQGRYWLRLDGQQTVSYRIPLDTPEFRITVDVQVKDGYAGLVFMASGTNTLYRFQIDDLGRYRLGSRRGAELASLLDWTAATDLKRGPDAVNQIEVRRVENALSLYANGIKLTTYALPADAVFQAQVGMTLDAVARDRVALAYFDNLVVRVPQVAGAP
jgi:hypothetical protein